MQIQNYFFFAYTFCIMSLKFSFIKLNCRPPQLKKFSLTQLELQFYYILNMEFFLKQIHTD